ncbi:unnamed protein product [Prunus armeniaca]
MQHEDFPGGPLLPPLPPPPPGAPRPVPYVRGVAIQCSPSPPPHVKSPVVAWNGMGCQALSLTPLPGATSRPVVPFWRLAFREYLSILYPDCHAASRGHGETKAGR